MITLREKMNDPRSFLWGVELVTTRGTMEDDRAIETRDFATDIAGFQGLDWASITDNAGGNPMLSPTALGKPLLFAGKEVVIHLSCKDMNRNFIEAEAWRLASEGFNNILCLSGDYPTTGYHGQAKPVFDIDSIGLLTLLDEMNRGMTIPKKGKSGPIKLTQTDFFLGCVVTNFKIRESEVVPQLMKLDKKIQQGARFIINQIGYDSRKCHELLLYLQRQGNSHIPLIGNVFVLTHPIAKFFNAKRMPGVIVSDGLLAESEKQSRSPDKGRRFYLELAARQCAIYRGLGYRGVYLGGVEEMEAVEEIMRLEKSYGPDDWKTFAREISYSRPGEFFYFEKDEATGLADASRLNPSLTLPLEQRRKNHNYTLNYRLSKWTHDLIFTPGTANFNMMRKIYEKSAQPEQGPGLMRFAEKISKEILFSCKDCGDCSLPDIAFLCPESQCVKNERNGPCGGTRDGQCEIEEFDCIWARAYDRLKAEGREHQLLDHVPVIQNQGLRGQSSWGNTYLGRDHHGSPTKETPSTPPPQTPSH